MTEKIRLQRYLASAGVAARRKAEELIVAGHVRVNGKQVRLLGTKVDPLRDHVTVNGEAVTPLDNFYVLLNKPKGCVTAVEDERGRPTVMEYLPNLPIPVRPVGRLDFYAEGVVLLTNDGDLAARLVSTQRHIPKTYHVKIRGEVRREHLTSLREGVRLEDGTTTLPAEVNPLPGESRHSWLAITVIENKQHQVQRMMEALGYQVQKLQCVAFANLTFHGLRVGDARELTQPELNALRDLVDLDHSVTARGAWRTYREDTDIPRRAREKLRAEAAEADAPLPPIEDDDAPPRVEPRGARADARPARAGRRDARSPRGRDEGRRPARPDDRRPRPSRDEGRRPARPDDRRPRPSRDDGRAATPRPSGSRPTGDRAFGKPRASAPTGDRGFGKPRASAPTGDRGFGKPRASAPTGDRAFGKPRASAPTGDRGVGKPRASAPTGDRGFGKPRASAPSPSGRPERRGQGGDRPRAATGAKSPRARAFAPPSPARPTGGPRRPPRRK
jgi:23S rRNA pseudouridine2605 synthase